MSFLNTKIGLDIGTMNTRVFILGKGVVLEEPTVVAVSKTDGKIIAMGKEAKEMLGKTPEDIMAYKPIRNGVISDFKVSEDLIGYFLNKVLGKFAMFKPFVMVSIPSSINSTERRAIIEAVTNAGAKDVFVVKETVLSAVGAGVPIHEPSGRMIVNIGAGTTDVAVISLGGIVNSQSIKHAGEKINLSIIEMVKRKYSVVIGDKTAENVKRSIGSAVEEEKEKAVLIKGRDYESGLPKEIKVLASDVYECLQKDLQNITRLIKDIFATTPPEVSADIIDNGILLVGGGAFLKNLDKYIQNEINVPVSVPENPDLVTIQGMGKMLEHLDVYQRNILSKKVG
jgi:rod shape-determining protein MreB and related proteins